MLWQKTHVPQQISELSDGQPCLAFFRLDTEQVPLHPGIARKDLNNHVQITFNGPISCAKRIDEHHKGFTELSCSCIDAFEDSFRKEHASIGRHELQTLCAELRVDLVCRPQQVTLVGA
jgi:hypothetical protein